MLKEDAMATRTTRDRTPRMVVGLIACALAAGVPGQVAADFDGDGRADIAAGIPYETVNSMVRAGMVMVVAGGPAGITADDELWHQDGGLEESCEPNEYFGSSLAIGDFDGDGYDDLAVGVSNEELAGEDNAGVVHVIYGTPSGLTAIGDQLFSQDNATSGSSAEAGDYFGFSLAAADFNGDGYDDLAIGSPFEDLGATVDTGAVVLLFGTSSGLDATGSRWLLQSYADGDNEAGDHYGYALAAGDFDGDGYADLVMSAPGEDVGAVDSAGAVNIMWGSATGPMNRPGDDEWHQDRSGISGVCETDDRFGTELAAGDFDGDGSDELVVGVPLEDVEDSGVFVDAGMIHVIPGSAGGLTATGSKLLFQNTFGTNSSEEGDAFGATLVTDDFDGDGYRDLVVGTPLEDWSTTVDTGMVQVIMGSASGLVGSQAQSIAQSHLLVGAANNEDDLFGFALAAGDVDGDGYGDLAVGTPGETLGGASETGSVYLLYGSASGLSLHNDYFDQCTTGYNGGCDAYDHFGNSLAVRSTAGAGGDGIFSDGFESGTTGAWSSSAP